MSNYPHLAGRIFNTPLMIDESYLATFISAFGAHKSNIELADIILSDGTHLTPEMALGNAPGGNNDRQRNYQVIDGVAVINISGTLVNKGSVRTQSGMMGYNGVLAQFSEALDDSAVDSILFDINSPGGEVSGCFDLCDLLYEFRDVKPTAAFVGEKATSAAYAVASSCSTIYSPRTGMCGSIGVVTAHQSMQKALEDKGIKVTMLYSGKHKVDGNPYNDLPEDVAARIQDQLDTTRQLFVETVARNRGLSEEAVYNTEAAVYNGKDALEVGLVDKVMSLAEAIDDMKVTENSLLNKDDETYMEQEDLEIVAEDADLEVELTDEAPDARTGEAHTSVITDLGLEDAGEEILASADQILTACEEHKMVPLMASFLRSKVSVEGLATKIAEVTELRGVLAASDFNDEQSARIEMHYNSPAELARAILDEKVTDHAIVNVTPSSVEDNPKAAVDADFYKGIN